jgi:hypothetical protein
MISDAPQMPAMIRSIIGCRSRRRQYATSATSDSARPMAASSAPTQYGLSHVSAYRSSWSGVRIGPPLRRAALL